VAYRLQDNPGSSSSDGVPPKLEVLGFAGFSAPNRSDRLARPVLPVGATGLTGHRRALFSSDRCDPARSSACVLANLASTHCNNSNVVPNFFWPCLQSGYNNVL